MYKIRTYNKIDQAGMDRLPSDFSVADDDDYDGIILRSYKMSEAEITGKLAAVARAGAGVNNIPVQLYTEKGIVVFNTPGANANAVKEMVILGALISSRKVFDGIEWVQSLKGTDTDAAKEVENQKAQFTGPELLGKSMGVVGLGAVGVKVANIFASMGMNVYGYDPYISIENAWGLSQSVSRAGNIEWIFENCDYVSIHVPFIDATKEFVNAEMLRRAKDGIRVLNFARGELVNDDAMTEAVKSGKVSVYVTDFPNNKLLGIENIIPIPHLGASTPEAETNCAIMAADQIADYLLNGNIVNSVNYPACSLGVMTHKTRITLTHKNIPNMVGQITTILANDSINISDMINKSRDEYAYTMLDLDDSINDEVYSQLKSIEGVLKVRILNK